MPGGLLVALLFVSCGTAGEPSDAFDSAPEWVATVDLEISGLDEDGRGFLAPSEMHVVGPHAFLLHREERRIRTFDRVTGGSLRTLVGPDDLRMPRGFGVFGDTLWVWDHPMFRLFAVGSGETIGARPAAERRSPRRASSTGVIRGVSLISGREMVASPFISAASAVRGEVHERPLLHMSVLGEVLDTLATISVERGIMGFVHDQGGGIYSRQPFSDNPLYAFSPDLGRLAVLDRRVKERDQPHALLSVRDIHGRRGFTTEVEYGPRRIDSRWVDGVVRNWQANLGLPYSHSEPLIRERLYTPDHVPAASDMRVDAEGRIWLRAWDLSDAIRRHELRFRPPEQSKWLVIGADGAPVGRLELPSDLRWLYAYGNTLWVTRTDTTGAGVIFRYRSDGRGASASLKRRFVRGQ